MKRWNPVLCQVPWCPKFHQHEPPGSYREWCWTVVHQASGLGSIWDWFSLKLFEALPATNQETCVRLFSAHLPAKPKGSHSFFLIFHQKMKKPCVPRVPRSATVHAEGVKDSHSHNWDAALSEKVEGMSRQAVRAAGQFQDEGQPWCRCNNFCQGFFFKHTYNYNL